MGFFFFWPQKKQPQTTNRGCLKSIACALVLNEIRCVLRRGSLSYRSPTSTTSGSTADECRHRLLTRQTLAIYCSYKQCFQGSGSERHRPMVRARLGLLPPG